jgi:hypothetical protein
VVDLLGTSGLGQHEPDGSGQLEGEVVGDVVEDDTESGGLDVVQESDCERERESERNHQHLFFLYCARRSRPLLTDNPVTQPLSIVTLLRRLQGVTSQISGKSPSDEVGDGLSETKEVEEDQEGHAVERKGGQGSGVRFESLINENVGKTHVMENPRTPYVLGILVLASNSFKNPNLANCWSNTFNCCVVVS